MCRRIHAPLVVTAAVQPGVSARLGSSEHWRSAVPGHDEAVAASLKRPELSVDGGRGPTDAHHALARSGT